MGANDTLVFAGFDNIFTLGQTFKTTADPAIKIYKNTNGNGTTAYMYFNLNDSGSNETNYGDIGFQIKDQTDGSEDGIALIDTKIAGSNAEVFRLNDNGSGSLRCGGPNRYIELSESGLTLKRTYTLPDTSTTLTGLAATQTNTAAKTFNDQTIKLRNPADTFSYNLIHGAIGANRDITLPVLTAGDTFTFNDFAATLKNKTIYSGHDFGHPAANVIRGTGVDNPYAGHATGATLNRTGLYTANSDTEASGYVGSAFTAIGTGSIFRSTTEGYGRSFATGAVANNNAGLRHGSSRFRREWTIYCIARFSLSSTSDIRLFFGFASTTAEIAGETTLNNESGFGIGKRTGDTNWFTYRNDGDATEDRVDTTIAAHTNMTTMEMQLDSTNAQWRIDGVAQTAQTTELPAAATDLAFHLEIETGAGAADKTINILPIFFRVGT